MALAVASPAHIARAQDKVDQPPPPAAEAPAPAAADEIDALVVRVALYPDALLALARVCGAWARGEIRVIYHWLRIWWSCAHIYTCMPT